MRITQRPYQGDHDQALMADLVRAQPQANLHVVDLPYRLSSWAFDDPDNVCLWENERGEVLAWAVLHAHGIEGQPSGQIEPLGVRADVRGLGLGRAILAEGLQRLMQIGAGHIFVETDNYRNAAFTLYQAAEFQVVQDVSVYRKDYPS